MAHEWFPIIRIGGQYDSSDTISMCRKCGIVKHDYEPDTPGYPVFFGPYCGPIAQIGGGLAESHDEPECLPYPYWGYKDGKPVEAPDHE